MKDDINSYRALVSAAVLLAVYDCCQMPINKDKKLTLLARSGFDFIMNKHADGYLAFLNIDPNYFRTHLVDSMFERCTSTLKFLKVNEVEAARKRLFRINYKLWQQEQSKKRVGTWLNLR